MPDNNSPTDGTTPGAGTRGRLRAVLAAFLGRPRARRRHRLLEDIGLPPDHRADAAARNFWDVPSHWTRPGPSRARPRSRFVP